LEDHTGREKDEERKEAKEEESPFLKIPLQRETPAILKSYHLERIGQE
jgi:hypothetical protein